MTVSERPYLIRDYYMTLRQLIDGIRCNAPLALITPLAESHLLAAFLVRVR